jgi:hypothetical protein
MNDTPRLTLSATLRDHDSPCTVRTSVTLDPDADLGETVAGLRLLLISMGYHPDVVDEAIPDPFEGDGEGDSPEEPPALEPR